MATNTRKRSAIVGVGEAAPPIGSYNPSHWGLAAEAAGNALKDAGLTKKDIDGVVFCTAYGPPFPYPSSTTGYFCEYTGIGPVWYENYPYGSMPTGAAIVHRAVMGIDAGLASTVLVVSSDNPNSRRSRPDARDGRSRSGFIETMAERAFDSQYEWPYGPWAMAAMGLVANRHMYKYGTTSEQMAEVAVAARQWASLNPIAYHRSPIMVEDVLNSRMISSPIHLLDSCVVSDGGTAYVVVGADRAKDFENPPVWIMGIGEKGKGRYLTWADDLADIRVTEMATKQALEMAGVTISDIDLAYPYDASTIFTIGYLEQLGFCKIGEGGSFVEAGRIAPGGELAVNTHGGLMSCRHSGFSGHSFHLAEAVKQLRGGCGERQVKDAKLAILQCEGGWFNQGVTILGRL